MTEATDKKSQHEKDVATSAAILRDKLAPRFGTDLPKIAVILGSGLGALGDKVAGPVRIPYADLPGFPVLTVQGHAGEIIAGMMSEKPVIMLKGRKHFYETDDAYPLKTMIRSLKVLGVEILFISNAAGSLRHHIPVGSLMTITDHINYMGLNPLTGVNDDSFGPRFPPMRDAYDPALRHTLKLAAQNLNIPLQEGVYVAFRGPTFETPAEIKMAQMMGGDAVGMSSVPDCIIARHCGLRVIGCSCITNMGAGLSDESLSHSHTLENAQKVAAQFEKLVAKFIEIL